MSYIPNTKTFLIYTEKIRKILGICTLKITPLIFNFRFMKKSEQAKTPEPEDVADMISNLPDEVLQLILSRLQGSEEVVRTSILSRRWRYLWTSVPSIDIDCTRGPLEELDRYLFLEFVYWVLLNKPMDLDSFRLWCSNLFSMLPISQWIHAAVMRKVKLLDLMFCPREESEDIEIPDCLATCGSLEVLKLCLLGFPLCLPKPNITGFQALRVLQLKEVNLFDDNVVKYFLESCPLLEALSLIDCAAYNLFISSSKLKHLIIDTRYLVSDEEGTDTDDDDWTMCETLEICCPKLEFLRLTGFVAKEFLFQSLYSLKKAVIHAEDLFESEKPPYDWVAKISHVESLSISLYCIEGCFNPRVNAPISLPNLKTLEISMDCFNMDALISFLIWLPHLESLHLIFIKYLKYGLDKLNLEEAETINILARHLKKVEFPEFGETIPILDVARVLLEHGNELEEMVFGWNDAARFHERSMETVKEVSKFHKASSTVKLTAVFDPIQVTLF